MPKGKKKVNKIYLHAHASEIVAKADEVGKFKASKIFGISIGGVDSAYLHEGYPEKCGKWYLNHRKSQHPTSQAATDILSVASEVGGTEKILEALSQLFDELARNRSKISELESIVKIKNCKISVLENEIIELNAEVKRAKALNNNKLVEKARNFLCQPGD